MGSGISGSSESHGKEMAYEMTRENRDKRCQSNRNKADGVPLKQLTEETRREGAVVVAVIKKKGQE